MKYIVRFRGTIVGLFDEFIEAFESINPADGLDFYELIVIEETNAAITEMMPKTIKVILAGREF